MFNARSESLTEKPSFSRLLDRRRAVAIITGFYEWRTDNSGEKQPFYVHGAGGPLFVAALYDIWGASGASGEMIYTFTMLTAKPCPALVWLHDRQPVMLDARGVEAWLGSENYTRVYKEVVDVRRGPPSPNALSRHGLDAAVTPTTTICAHAGHGSCGTLQLAWHAVTKAINRTNYDGDDADTPLGVGSPSRDATVRVAVVGSTVSPSSAARRRALVASHGLSPTLVSMWGRPSTEAATVHPAATVPPPALAVGGGDHDAVAAKTDEETLQSRALKRPRIDMQAGKALDSEPVELLDDNSVVLISSDES